MQTCKQHNNSIKFPADLSADSVKGFLNKLDSRHDPKLKEVSIDCSQLNEVTSSHIGVLWQAFEHSKRNGVQIKLLYATHSLLHVLQVLDMIEFFEIDDGSDIIGSEKTKFMEQDIIHQKYEDTFYARIESIGAALKNFERLLSKLKLPETVVFDLKTVFYEVAYNIYDHGTLERRDEITFKAEVYKNRIVLEFSDQGLPFDPTSQVMNHHFQDAINNRKIRGFGLMMINKLIDSVSYVYSDNRRNVLKLEKTWRYRNE